MRHPHVEVKLAKGTARVFYDRRTYALAGIRNRGGDIDLLNEPGMLTADEVECCRQRLVRIERMQKARH